MVKFTHITGLCLMEASKFRKLYIRATKPKVNIYDEYLTRSDNYDSISSGPPHMKRIT